MNPRSVVSVAKMKTIAPAFRRNDIIRIADDFRRSQHDWGGQSLGHRIEALFSVGFGAYGRGGRSRSCCRSEQRRWLGYTRVMGSGHRHIAPASSRNSSAYKQAIRRQLEFGVSPRRAARSLSSRGGTDYLVLLARAISTRRASETSRRHSPSHTVSTAKEARHAVECGVDVVVAQGWEAGGHVRGTVATMPLIPAVVDAVGSVPVMAAGGIADGRGFAAALALGACGAWIGTRFLASNEVAIHPHYRERLLAATEDDTVYLEELFDIGWPRAPHRVLRNSTVAAWESAGRPTTGTRPGEGEVVATSKSRGPIVRYRSYTPGADAEGDIDALSLWAGQSVALIHKVQPAAEIVREIVSEAQTILLRLTQCRLGN